MKETQLSLFDKRGDLDRAKKAMEAEVASLLRVKDQALEAQRRAIGNFEKHTAWEVYKRAEKKYEAAVQKQNTLILFGFSF